MPSEVSTVSGDQLVEGLRRELAEAREQQAATAEILAAISNSPTDLQRVCDTSSSAEWRRVGSQPAERSAHPAFACWRPSSPAACSLKCQSSSSGTHRPGLVFLA